MNRWFRWLLTLMVRHVGQADSEGRKAIERTDSDVFDLHFRSKLRSCAFGPARGVSFVGSFTPTPSSVLRQLLVDRPTALLSLACVSIVSLGTVAASLK